MTTPSWPVGAAGTWIKDSYRERPERNVAAFAVDIGPALESRMSAIGTILIDASFACNDATAYAALLAFYTTDCKDGSLLFTNTHPRTGVAAQTFKFESFALSQIRGGTYFVALALRYFP